METFTGFTSELDALTLRRRRRRRRHRPLAAGRGAGAEVAGDRHLRRSRAGAGSAAIINFKDKTDDFNNVIAQLYVRQAIDYLIDQPAIIKGVYKGAAVPAYDRGADRAGLAVRPGDRGQARLPVQPGQGGRDPQGPRLEGRAGRARRRAPSRAPRRTSAAPASRRGRRSRSSGPTSPSRSRRPARSSPRSFASEAKAGCRDQHHPADQDVQLPDLQLQRLRTRRRRSTRTTGASTTTAACSRTTTRRPKASGTSAAASTSGTSTTRRPTR